MIQERREYLLETIEMDKEHKLRILKVRLMCCHCRAAVTISAYQHHVALIVFISPTGAAN